VKLCYFVSGFTQFLARDVQDTFPQLVDNGLRMLLQLLTSWKNALTPNSLRGSKDAPGADGARGGNRDMQVARKTEHVQVSGDFYVKVSLLSCIWFFKYLNYLCSSQLYFVLLYLLFCQDNLNYVTKHIISVLFSL
jgi:hypothetical protein